MKIKVNANKSHSAAIIHEKTNGSILSIQLMPKQRRNWDLELLRIKITKDSKLELHVRDTDSMKYGEIPSPKRKGHKIANLEVNQPIRYKTNSKFECFGTRQAQRKYIEYDTILEYLGAVKSFDFSLEQPMAIEIVNAKVIDERNILK